MCSKPFSTYSVLLIVLKKIYLLWRICFGSELTVSIEILSNLEEKKSSHLTTITIALKHLNMKYLDVAIYVYVSLTKCRCIKFYATDVTMKIWFGYGHLTHLNFRFNLQSFVVCPSITQGSKGRLQHRKQAYHADNTYQHIMYARTILLFEAKATLYLTK